MNNPLFSIIMPTFKRPVLLKRAIESVLCQTFQNFELIIIGDANDLETVKTVNDIKDDRIVFIQHEKKRGAAAAYNTGIKISRGAFISFLDDDDEYLPLFLQGVYNHFKTANNNLGFIWTGITKVRDTDEGELLIYSKIWPQQFSTKQQGLIAATSIGNGFGVCLKRECIDETGLYDESLQVAVDTDFLFKLAKKFACETIPEILVKIHHHSSSQLTNKHYDKIRLETYEKILGRNKNILEDYPELFCIHFIVLVKLSYKLGYKRKGRKIMFSIIKKVPFRLMNYIDMFFYEFFGKDMISYYDNSKIKSLAITIKKQLLR